MSHVYLFAHPDDEFGCFSSISTDTRTGCDVRCCFLTDGGYGGQSIARRELESIDVLGRLGVPTRHIFFLGRQEHIRDGRLPRCMARARDALMAYLTRVSSVTEIFAPAWEGGHQDHDAAHVVACALGTRIAARVVSFPLYTAYHARSVPFRVMHPLKQNGKVIKHAVDIKQRIYFTSLLTLYPSQWKTWAVLFPFVASKVIFGGAYSSQVVNLPFLLRRPHLGKLLYEKRNCYQYSEMEKMVRELLMDAI